MKRYFIIIIALIIFNGLVAQGEWKTLKTGAGGWITGMDIHPSGSPIYVRSDVGGAYKYNNANQSWLQLVTAETMPISEVKWDKYGGVLSIVSSPLENNIAYMAYHDGIYKSTNTASTWVKTQFPQIEIRPNDDDSKLSGERLAVDPINSNVVYFGSIEDGIWYTENGNDWQEITDLPQGAAGRGVRSIVFNSSYGTSGNKTNGIYVLIDGEGVFESQDAGASWSNISDGLFPNNDPWFYDAEINENGHLFICGIDSGASYGLYVYDGTDWDQRYAEDLDIAIGVIAIDPFNNDRILLFSYGFTDTYRTLNGNDQEVIWEYLPYNIEATNIPWLAYTSASWFTLGEVAFDPANEDKLWLTHGTGTYEIFETGGSTITWNESSVDQEHLVSNDVVSLSNGRVITAHWDFNVFVHDDVDTYPSETSPSSRFNSCWDLEQSASDENFIVALIEDERDCCIDDETRNSSYTTDGGDTWVKFNAMPGSEKIFGQIAVSTDDNDNMVWVPTFNQEPYYTTDRGDSWTQVELPGQSSNCCMSYNFVNRKPLCSDKVASNTFYLYDWAEGHIFKSTDGGASWNRLANVLPVWSYNGKLIAVPNNEGHLLFANGPEEAESLIEGLMISTDGGNTWTEIENTDKVLNVTTGKQAPGADYPTIFICGEVEGIYGYFMSIDQGLSWEQIGTYPMGIYDAPGALVGNKDEFGSLFLGYKGNGFAMRTASASSSDPVLTDRIHIDQFGYLPSSSKVAVVSNPIEGYNSSESYEPGNVFKLIDVSNDEEVFEGDVDIWNDGSTHDQSGDQGWWFDFSDFVTPGTYYILDEENNTKSFDFEITEDVYGEVLQAATKMFYYNRCNASKDAPYAGASWEDGMNFENDLQDFNARYVWDQGNPSLEKDLSGGWFDAGDYNKYVTFASDPIHNLLSAYEENPNVFPDNWNIPESGNGIPDLLDEVIWELEWLERMTNDDGSVHIKIGSISYGDNGSNPPSENEDPRYYGPTCSSAAIAVAGMFAHAANVFETVDGLESYAAELEDVAIACWANVADQLESGQLDLDCDDGTIKSGDADLDWSVQYEYALVAAVHLFELTGDNIYNDFIAEHLGYAEMIQFGWWGGYKVVLSEALLYYTTFANATTDVKNTIINSITPHVSQDWNGFYGFNEDDLYRAFIPQSDYVWGSNMVKANYGLLNKMVVKYAINPSNDDSYEQKASEQLHYFHGLNPLGLTMLSNMYDYGADHSANEIYHTWFADGSIYDHALNSPNGPAPGFLVGGPNIYYTNPNLSPPYGQPAQKSYLEFNPFTVPENAWEITEPGIYYQAAYIRLLAAFAPLDEIEDPVACETYDLNDGESGWGIWNDGGADATRTNNDAFANSGNYSFLIKDNTSTSVITTDNLDLTGYEELKIDFNYLPVNLNGSEDFWLQISIDGGLTFNTLEEWNLGDEFENNVREFETVTVYGPFTQNTQIRFRCDASGNNDKVYIDDILIEGCETSSASCSDGIMNGLETGIDCGGPDCMPCTGCDVFDDNDLEIGLGYWIDGGVDARRNNLDQAFAKSGDFCVRLQDDTDESNITTIDLDLSDFASLNFSFSFITSSIEIGEGLILEYSIDGGGSFIEVQSWILNDDFVNGVREDVSTEIVGPFSTNTQLRLRADGSTNNDRIYIDDIVFESCFSGNIISESTDVRFANASLDFTVYPNPVIQGGNINLEINSNTAYLDLVIYNNLGNLVDTRRINNNEYGAYKFETGKLQPGNYLLRIVQEGNQLTKRLIVIK